MIYFVLFVTCQGALANAQGFSPEMSSLSMLKNSSTLCASAQSS